MFKRLQDGLTAEMYAEFTLCKDLPLQCKHEQLVEARQAALLGKKIQEAKALSEQRIALGYTPSGISAADMRLRLTALLPRIDARYLDLIAVDDINYLRGLSRADKFAIGQQFSSLSSFHSSAT
jgi:hypothetical protein